jgi:small-conductance mechanosensitive channel
VDPPIPVAEVMVRAEEVDALLRTLELELPPDAHVTRIQSQLPVVSGRLSMRLERSQKMLENNPGLRTIDSLTGAWRSSASELSSWLQVLTTRAVWLDEQRARLASLDETWSRMRQADPATLPSYVVERVAAVRAAVATTQRHVETQRAAALSLQDQVARQARRCEDILAALGQARRRAAGDLFSRESRPIWNPVLGARALSEVPGRIQASLRNQAALLREFVEDQAERIIFHGAVIVGLVALFCWARRRVRAWRNPDMPVVAMIEVFDYPVVSALSLGLPLGFWLYVDEPRWAVVVLEVCTLIPMIVTLQTLLPTTVLRPALYTLAAFFVVDRVRDLSTVLPLVERTIFLLEMLAEAALFAWTLWSGRIRNFLALDEGSLLGRGAFLAMRLAFAGASIAFVAGVLGNMTLARLIGTGILASGYLAFILLAAQRPAQAVVAFALRVKPLRWLRMVQRHRAAIEASAQVVLRAAAVIAWMLTTLDYFGVLDWVVDAGRAALGAGLTYGALRISLGDVLAVAITLYVSFALSRVVQFVLHEDVFPRLELGAGLPYAVTSLLRYTIIFVGFIAALLVLGVDLDKVTILGGAFGIGIGFGLQNVVNNFVSGLIVLFERPVRIGDAVEIGNVQGEVRRLGIRSSTVRTWEGAEVIVPNATLVSDKVTNWTPVDRCRRIDIQVTVALGTPPDEVMKVLAAAAHAHPDIASAPAPQPLFLGFGDGTLRFELRAWTRRLDRWLDVKSEVGIAVDGALREAGMTISPPQQLHIYRESR